MTDNSNNPGRDSARTDAVVIGTSAGAVEALSVILPALPPGLAVPIVIVVHLPPDKDTVLPQILAGRCRLPVKEAEDKEPMQAGTVYLTPPNYHVLIENDRRLSLSSDEPVLYSRPSIDVLFESAADAFGSGVIGIVLTGANSDGAKGLKAICAAGGVGIVQTPGQAQASTMPLAALRECTTALVMSLEEIAALIDNGRA